MFTILQLYRYIYIYISIYMWWGCKIVNMVLIIPNFNSTVVRTIFTTRSAFPPPIRKDILPALQKS